MRISSLERKKGRIWREYRGIKDSSGKTIDGAESMQKAFISAGKIESGVKEAYEMTANTATRISRGLSGDLGLGRSGSSNSSSVPSTNKASIPSSIDIEAPFTRSLSRHDLETKNPLILSLTSPRGTKKSARESTFGAFMNVETKEDTFPPKKNLTLDFSTLYFFANEYLIDRKNKNYFEKVRGNFVTPSRFNFSLISIL